MHTFSEKTISSKTIFEGQVFTVTLDESLLENGKIHRREVVHHGGGCGILALNEQGEVALVRQYRYAAGKELIEIPAGKIEVGEPPAETAKRELREEAGLTAKHLVPFGDVLPTCAYCTEVIYIYLATGLTSVSQNLDEDEFLAVFWMDLTEAVNLVMSGEINDSKTVSALLRGKKLLDEGKISL